MRAPRRISGTVTTFGRLWPAWCIPLGMLFAALALFEAGALASEKVMSAPAAQQKLSAGELILIDIRSPKEWAETGIPKGARAITMHNPKGKRAFLEAIKAAVNGNQSQEIALICAVGGRSRWAQGFLTKHGFTNVADVSEGMLGRSSGNPGWIKRGMPVQACDGTAGAAASGCPVP